VVGAAGEHHSLINTLTLSGETCMVRACAGWRDARQLACAVGAAGERFEAFSDALISSGLPLLERNMGAVTTRVGVRSRRAVRWACTWPKSQAAAGSVVLPRHSQTYTHPPGMRQDLLL
jgi:hypothetical protein